MHGLAWDDDPSEYMTPLAKAIRAIDESIVLQVTDREDAFVTQYAKKRPDFVITDLAEEDASGEPDMSVGVRIAQKCAADELPVYVITNHYDVLTPAKLGLPEHVQIRSKATPPSWMAMAILDDLGKQGLRVSARRVFVIYGHDRATDGLSDSLIKFLQRRGLEVECIRGNNLDMEILDGLVSRMTGCSAVIAVCTPDDPICDPAMSRIEKYQPRPNVLLEMGLAMGLSRGLQRLIILQRWGDQIEKMAELPSNFGGVIPIRISGDFANAIPAILSRLSDLGVALLSDDA